MIPAPGRLITLTTDFGTRDGYAAAMKGVIRHTARHALVEDFTHDIPPGDIRTAAWTLRTAVPFYPRGSVHIAVIDPGVGTSRHAMLAFVDGQFLIGPDNGVFSWLLREADHLRAWRLSEESWRTDTPSNTFHGRDLFAHAAALVVQEGDVERVCGEPIQPVILDDIAPPTSSNGKMGVVLHIDHYGNVVTNLRIPEEVDAGNCQIELPLQRIKLPQIHRTYGDVQQGEVLALIGSHGFVEIAVREGSAAEKTKLSEGDPVLIH